MNAHEAVSIAEDILRDARRPIPPPSVVAVGRLTAEERDELLGLRRAVTRVRGDLDASEKRCAHLRHAADWWMVYAGMSVLVNCILTGIIGWLVFWK